MKLKTILFLISFFFYCQVLGQEKVSSYFVPDTIPKNVIEYTRKKLIEISDLNKGLYITASIRANNKKIYKIDFLPINTFKYFDAEKDAEIEILEINNAISFSLGTQVIPIGWFRELEDFGGLSDQPFFRIEIGKSNAYLTQITHKNVDWGYSSHHFEQSPWWDCYGKYTLTTKKVSLFINRKILNTIYFYGCDFSNLEYNYYGHHFENTDVSVDNNATEYQVTFRIDFEPSSITGPDNVCSNQQASFFLTNNSFPFDSIIWTKSDNLSLISGQGTENYKVMAPVPGDAWVRAKIITECGEIDAGTKNFWVDKPVISSNPPLAFYNGNTFNDICNLQTYSTNMTVLGAPSAIWTRIAASPSNTTWTQNGNNISFYFYNVNQTAVYRISASNVCGTTSYDFGFKSINCGDPCNPAYVISPNPASNSVIITLDIPAPCDQTMAMAAATEGQVTIYDKQGSVKKQKKYKYNSQIEIDVQDLTNGFYIAEIYDGKTIVKKSFIVQH